MADKQIEQIIVETYVPVRFTVVLGHEPQIVAVRVSDKGPFTHPLRVYDSEARRLDGRSRKARAALRAINEATDLDLPEWEFDDNPVLDADELSGILEDAE